MSDVIIVLRLCEKENEWNFEKSDSHNFSADTMRKLSLLLKAADEIWGVDKK